MPNLALCRVCLASNRRLHRIANTPYQEILQKLATEICAADAIPEAVCWVCLSVLRHGRRLADTARAAHEILTQHSLRGIQLSEDTESLLDKKLICKISTTPIQTLFIGKEFIDAPIKVEVKVEPTDNEEIPGFISEDEQTKYTSNEDESFTVKNEDISYDNTLIVENNEHSNKDIENEDTGNISESERNTSDLSENERNASDISENDQTIDNRSFIKLKHKVKDTSKRHGGNRSKPKSSSEVIVKDEKGLDCVRHVCQTCDKSYKQRNHLLRHLKSHASQSGQPPNSPPKESICEKCGKAFVNNYTLKKHLLSHEDIRKFACNHCSIKLVQKCDLIRHMRTHTGQKPFKCDICKKQYSQKAMMVRHMRIHTGEKPFSCERCGLKFNRHSSMVRHLKRRHFSSDKRHYKEPRRPQL